MAIDVYLQIEDIKGESQDDAHKAWIECISVNWALKQPKSATSSTAGGHTAERVEFSEIGFDKTADLASPMLAQHCAMGKTIPEAKLNSCAPMAMAGRSSITSSSSRTC
jgi:type VI secretion system secreted protein Hcp